MSTLHIEMRIGELVEQYPETLAVFAANGFSANSKESLFDELGASLMLKTALKVKGINSELFLNLLVESISGQTGMLRTEEDEPADKLNFLGYTYCPLKHTFRECFEEVLAKYLAETKDNDFKYYVPLGCGGTNPYDELWKTKFIDELPEVIAAVGFGNFFRQEFVDRFVDKGYFKAVQTTQVSDVFVSAGFTDPDDVYTIYSVFPLVMLIDKNKLGKLSRPKQWSDLLNPIYNNNIIIGASHGDIHEDIFLYINKEHGEEGLIRLAANIKDGWHASQMAKVAGSTNSEGAAIYVIPWMFAKSCPRTETTEIVWPLDGAITTPLYLLVKENAFNDYSLFIDFVMGSSYGQKSADNYFPVLNSKVDNKLPPGATFKWLGWDYIKAHPMDALKEQVMKVFGEHWVGESELKRMIL